MLDPDIIQWFFDPINSFINKGEIMEAFVGQEILAYSDYIYQKKVLFHWRKDSRGSQAELDYLVQMKDRVVPI